MGNEPEIIAKIVLELMALHGNDAETVAETEMLNEMRKGDVAKAADWMAVMYEIRKVQSGGSASG